MSRIRLTFPVKLLPAALTAALVLLGSTAVANAQYSDSNPSYGQSPSYDQGAPQDQYAQTDPPDRVARLAYTSGDVEFAPAGENDWGTADVNRPLVTGDRLLTGSGGRAALELGDAALRINDNSAFNFLDLDDTTTQVELSQGTLNLRVRRLGNGQVYEVDTPAVAFVANEPGTYRVDVAPNGNGAMVTVFEGSGTVYGENGVSRPVQAGQSYRFDDNTLANVAVERVPAPDDFDRFCEERDSRYTNSVSRRYVSDDVVGYDDLDQYGDWQSSGDYGEVWYPSRVSTGWAPYRDGHWAWIEPWGWTWVDDEPWGYAPFHYGRWVYVSNRWGWVPGPRSVRSVYAPALVAFVGGSGFSVSISLGGGAEPVGWFPLGPRDVYVPPYRASRNYFTNVNVTNIRNVYVNKTVINNYYGSYAAGRPYAGARQYAYRDNPHAFTAVPRNVFAGARPVRPAVLHVKPAVLARATVATIPHVAPTRASLAITPPKRPIQAPVMKAFNRTVVARHAPPPRPVPFAAREKVIAKQGGAPIPVAQLHRMRQQHAPAEPQRVHVVAAAPKPRTPGAPPNRPGNASMNAPHGQPPVVQAPRNGTRQQERAPNRPVPAPNAAQASAPNRNAESPLRPGELPSARFAHPHGHAPQQAGQAQQGAQMHAAQAEQDRQQAEQARQQADQARQNGQAQQRHADEDRARQQQQHAQQEQQRAQNQQRAEQDQQQQARQQQKAQQEQQQRAGQQRQQQAQQEQQQRAEQQRQQQAQQEQQRRTEQDQQQQARQQQQAQQEQQQRAEQQRQQQAQQEQQRRSEQQRQQQAQQEQQRRADQERQQQAQQEQQQRAERQRQQQAQQERQQQAQQEQQRRADQQRQQQAQQEQQRRAEEQRQQQAQQAQQRQAQMQQQRAEQARAQQQKQQHAPPPHQQEQKKKKDHDQQDDGGH